MLEPAVIPHARIERVLTRMTEWRVANIVRQTHGFYQQFIESEFGCNRPRNLRDLERMCQSGAIKVALMVDEHLSLIDQPSERRAMNNAVTVALKLSPVRVILLGMHTPATARLMSSVGRETGMMITVGHAGRSQ